MPLLDVTSALTDPMLVTRFKVVRRKENITDKGRVTTADAETSAAGVVCMASAEQLKRLPEEQRMGKVLSIVTKFRLRGPAKATTGDKYQPDLVRWPFQNGDLFVVRWIDDYSEYGPGFIQALAGSMDPVDRPPAP